MNRRGFVRGLLGLLGLGGVAATTKSEPKVKEEMGACPQNRLYLLTKDPELRAQCHERIVCAFEMRAPVAWNLLAPNPNEDWGTVIGNLIDQMILTGVGLAWLVPNKLGEVFEVYPLPTALASFRSAVKPDYPDGYYQIQPVYPGANPMLKLPGRILMQVSQTFVVIPAQQVLKVECPYPLQQLHDHIEKQSEIDRFRYEFMKLYHGSRKPGHLFVTLPGSQLHSL